MTPPPKPKRCGAKNMTPQPNLAAMRRKVKRLLKEVGLQSDLYNQGYWVALQWVLSNVLTPRPAKSRRKKGEV